MLICYTKREWYQVNEDQQIVVFENIDYGLQSLQGNFLNSLTDAYNPKIPYLRIVLLWRGSLRGAKKGNWREAGRKRYYTTATAKKLRVDRSLFGRDLCVRLLHMPIFTYRLSSLKNPKTEMGWMNLCVRMGKKGETPEPKLDDWW